YLRQDKQSLMLQCGDTPSIKKYKFESLNKVDFIVAGGRDFYSEEIENFLNNDSIPIGVDNSVFNMEEDILFLERLLSEGPCPIPPMIPNQTKSSIEEPEHSFSMGYEHFSTTLVTNEVAESSTKNLIPILHECEVASDNGRTWTDGGWMSSVLGSSVSLVASGSFSTPGGGIGGPSYEIPLLVVISLASFLGFEMVLLGRELKLEAWLL
nr:hypothetical protein [Tanacetum cinerariifolium]